MAFKKFQRKIYAALETTEGTSSTPDDYGSDYIETIDPTYSITNRVFERNPTRLAITPAPAVIAGSGASSGNPSATVEFSFTVELTGSGTVGTAPRWARLLDACGLEVSALDTATFSGVTGNASDQANCIFNGERISAGIGTSFNSGEVVGRCVSDTWAGDGTVYIDTAAVVGGTTVASADNIVGEVSDGGMYLTGGGGQLTNKANSWMPKSTDVIGGANSSSVTIRMVYNSTGGYVEGIGCRGNVEYVFVGGDRVLLNFTFLGVLNVWTDTASSTTLPVAEGLPIPPTFVGVSMGIQESTYTADSAAAVTSTIFSTVTINMGNELVVRENPSNGNGYDVAYITGRTPTLTFNPDAVTEATYAYWDRFLSGESTRLAMTIGSTAGNKFLFKIPALQFTGNVDGERDGVFVYDATATMTGGDYGSSIQEAGNDSGTTSTQTNSRLGTNNEFAMFQL